MKKILVIRFSSIGDIILTTPVVRCLATQMPEAEIHYLTKKSFAPILANNPYIKKVIAFEGSLRQLIPVLKAEDYSHIVDLHKNLRSVYILARMRKSFSTFSKLTFRKWLLVKFGINIMPKIHIAERYMKAVQRFGVVNDGKGLDFFIPPADVVDLQVFPAAFQNGYNGIVIGGKHNTKILPVDKVVEIIRKSELPVILLGGPEDHTNGETIRTAIGDKIFNACGQFSLMQSASLVKQARAIASNDTGLMHVAAAFNKNIISIWGNTVPEFGMSPYMPDAHSGKTAIAEVHGLKCRPCSRIGFDQCPKSHFRCMKDQDTEKIASQLNDFSKLS
ncbi:MAG TPA: glycosyltransferase family 9 protein [Bacteroidales bacterium]